MKAELRKRLLPMEPPHWQMVEERQDGAMWVHRLDGGWTVIISAAEESDGRTWVHLSTAHRDRMPTWGELVKVKREFFGPERKAVQVIPPDGEYVNTHPYCLHLFTCLDDDPLPDFTRGGLTL